MTVGSTLAVMAIGVSVTAATVYASCSVEYETVVRGRFVRCESVEYYWEAAGVDRAIEQMLERTLAQANPAARERVRERWREQQMLPGQRRPQSSFVAVVLVDWQASTVAPWRPDVGEVVELREPPREFHEFVRYLWKGSDAACQGAEEGSPVDLWITGPCCDTPFMPGDDGCLLRMNNVAPAPASMRDALTRALDGR